MAAFIDRNGGTQQVDLNADELVAMAKTGNPTAELNKKYSEADLKIGTAFEQIKASMGIILPGDRNPFGLKAASMDALMNGTGGFQAGNVQTQTSPFGTASRALTMISLIDVIESQMAKDRTTDIDTFYGMVANRVSVNTEHFEQPVISYDTLGGPEQAKAQRVAQGATPPKMMFFKTADRIRRIGSWTIGAEWTEQALKATTLDFVSLTMGRFLAMERDERAYRYISDLFVGNNDLIVGAVPTVMSASLDAASTGGVLTHKAFVLWLARNRKFRKITHVVCSISSYLKLEGRTGRPATNNYDPRLSTIDPQAVAMNVGFGSDVRVFLVDDAANGGPVPDNTFYGVDASSAISLVTNTSAAYSAVENFSMKRTQAMRMDWSEECFRTFGDADIRSFDILSITA